MTRRTPAQALLVALFALVALAASAQPRLDHADPYRLKVQQAGWVKLDIYGDYPSFTTGHPDYDQYEHWFVTRDGRPWEMCSRLSGSCRMSGFTGGMMQLELNAAEWLKTPGFVDIRMNEGLTADGHIDAPFSNAIRIPGLAVFGAPASIVSISKKDFVSGAPENEFVFRIAANNFDEKSVAVVFRGDEVVHPRRIYDGTTIEVAVPPKYRGMDGELPLQLRTDSGGYSETKYIRVLKPKAPTPIVVGKVVTKVETPNASPAGGLHVSTDAVLANRVRTAIAAKVGEAAILSLNVTAKDGVITLGGSMTSTELRSAAATAAANVSGVKRVVNSIGVK